MSDDLKDLTESCLERDMDIPAKKVDLDYEFKMAIYGLKESIRTYNECAADRYVRQIENIMDAKVKEAVEKNTEELKLTPEFVAMVKHNRFLEYMSDNHILEKLIVVMTLFLIVYIVVCCILRLLTT